MAVQQQLGNERTTAYTDGAELVMERIFDAPRELVWKVMTDPERVTNWWGPHGYTTTVVEMDVRPGGRWRWINHTTGGEDAPFKGEYLEVVPLERIVQTQIFDVPGFDDRAAINPVRQQYFGERRPASTLIGVAQLAVPGMKVEIEAVAGIPRQG